MEHLTSIAFPILGNLTKNLGPRVGTFAFLRGVIGTKSNRSGADVPGGGGLPYETDGDARRLA